MASQAASTSGWGSSPSDRRIALWLISVCALVFAMVVLGGVTRLTESGLSIVEWKPVTGVLPPFSEAAWQEEFAKYQAFPEYQKKNTGMSLEEFKTIFYFEYFHRLLGRLIGVVFFFPMVYFIVKRQVDRALGWKLSAAFILGGLQGVMGWYMVMSGLVDRPDVSQYRLTAHLALAFVVYLYLLWLAFDLLWGGRRGRWPGIAKAMAWFTALVFFQSMAGGFVAGLDAGFVYNTWPAMDGGFAPGGLLFLDPWYLNFLENHATVQFNHRLLAYAVAVFAAVLWWKGKGDRRARGGLDLVIVATALQFALGVLTLIYVVPIPLAAAHQAGALLLLTAGLYATHRMAGGRP